MAHIRASDGAIQPLRDHLDQVSAIAERVGDKIGLGLLGKLVGQVHDLGKYSQEFQDYILSANDLSDVYSAEEVAELRGLIDHSTLGARLLWNGAGSELPARRAICQLMAISAATHHSCAMDCLTPDGEDRFTARMNKELPHVGDLEEVSAIREEVESLLSSGELDDEAALMVKRLSYGCNTRTTAFFKLGLLTRMLTSILIDADRLNTADSGSPNLAIMRKNGAYPGWTDLIGQFEDKLKSFDADTAINKIRRDVSERCLAESARPTGVYQLTVPTGGGKTLSAMRFALHHAEKRGLERIVYVAPYISIVDQAASSIRGMFQDDVVLEHHSNIADNTCQPACNSDPPLASNLDPSPRA